MENVNQVLFAAIKDASAAKAASDKATAKKTGVYATFTRVASMVGVDAFTKSVDAVFDAIRDNVDGCAKAARCQPAKKPGTYQVPSAAMSAKSVLLGAFKYGVAMLDDDGETPRPFGKIRDDVKAARDAEENATASDAVKARNVLVALLLATAEAIESQEPDAVMVESYAVLTARVASWKGEHDAIAGVEPVAAKAEKGEVVAPATAKAEKIRKVRGERRAKGEPAAMITAAA